MAVDRVPRAGRRRRHRRLVRAEEVRDRPREGELDRVGRVQLRPGHGTDERLGPVGRREPDDPHRRRRRLPRARRRRDTDDAGAVAALGPDAGRDEPLRNDERQAAVGDPRAGERRRPHRLVERDPDEARRVGLQHRRRDVRLGCRHGHAHLLAVADEPAHPPCPPHGDLHVEALALRQRRLRPQPARPHGDGNGASLRVGDPDPVDPLAERRELDARQGLRVARDLDGRPGPRHHDRGGRAGQHDDAQENEQAAAGPPPRRGPARRRTPRAL